VGVLKLKCKVGDTVYLLEENIIVKGHVIHLSKKEKKWDEDFYDIDISESNYLTDLDNVIHNVLDKELFLNIEDLINSLKIDLQNRIIRKSL
jgi:hypothetical protein